MLEAVLKALKKTSKGSLQYDRSWMREGRAKEVLHSVASLTRLHCSPRDQEESITPEDIPKELSRPPAKAVTPKGHPDVWQDTCSRILEYEDDRKRRVQETVQALISEMECLEVQQQKEVSQQMDLLQQEWRMDRQRDKDHIAQMQIQELLEVREQQSKLKENRKTHAKRLNEKMREMEERQKQLEEMEIRRKEEQRERQEHLSAYQAQLHALGSSFAETLSGCVSPELLQMQPRHHLQSVVSAEQKLHEIVNPVREWSGEDVQRARTLLINTRNALSQLQADVVQANAKGREAEVKAEPVTPDKQEPDVQGRENHAAPATPDTAKTTAKDLGLLSGCVDVESFSLYEGLMREIKKWEEVYAPLENDEKLKKLRFELKKAVNTPVNAISSQSGRQLRDKLDRLLSLLAGAPVAGKPGISCQSHPLALHFCTLLLAKKIVLQAENQVASHQEAAFPLAAVAVGLWGRYPKFGELLLAQLYVRCPYLLPIYHQQDKGQDEEHFHRLLGYNYENKEMEAQDQFLKRMSGIVCFYAALLQTSPPPSYVAQHPHGIQHGWQCLARLLNLRPRFDITATVLYHFLLIAGSALYRVYGMQMHKLICFMHTDYMEQIRRVSIGESGGPVTRLETFLTKTVRNRRISSPDGLLATGFWNT